MAHKSQLVTTAGLHASLYLIVDGAWGEWSRLSECSVTCGIGLRLKTRKCDNPAPKYGGKPCEGDDQESEVCISGRRCPGEHLHTGIAHSV